MTTWQYRKAEMAGIFYILKSKEDYDGHVATGLTWEELGKEGWELVSTEKDNDNVWGYFKRPLDEVRTID